MHEVSFYEKLSHYAGNIPLDEMLDRIKSGHYGYLVKALRLMLKEGNLEGYSQAKLTLPSFTTCGLYDGRRISPNMRRYNNLTILDIDKQSEDELIRVKKVVCQCQYTYACFVSPSGNGLKVIVCVSTGPGEHRNTFLAVQQFYEALTGVKIDPSGKDISRLCFVSLDPDLYRNPGSTVFVPLQDAGQPWPAVKPGKPKLVGAAAVDDQENTIDKEKNAGTALAGADLQSAAVNPGTDHSIDVPTWATHQPISRHAPTGIIETIARCKAYVGRHCSFTEGQRNTYVFALAIQFRCAGLPEDFALMELLQDYNFDEHEVRNCVKSAYGYVWPNDPLLSSATPTLPADADAQPAPIEKPPAETPPPVDKKSSSKKYNLKKAETLFSQWYETHYNEVTGCVEWRHANTDEPFCRLEDHHENSMLRHLHHAGQPIPIQMMHIMINSDFSPDFNPFTAYRNSLRKYDGETDYIRQLSDTVQTDDPAYFTDCFRKWFVGYAVSLVVDTIVNQTVIVFVGAQGVGKTSWMKRLVPPALRNYLGTAALQTDSKDTSIQLSECALIILDEMENLNRKDLASFKELITRPEIRIRRPYGRNSENLKHRASFIAAVNARQILTDPTGSRRYLCSNVTALDYQHTVDIDGAFAQAYALYESGFKYWFNMDEIRELTSRNEDFMSKSVEEEMIEIWMEPVTHEEWTNRNKFANAQSIQLLTATQVALKLMEKAKLTLADNMIVKIGKVMHKLGYERIRKGNNFLYMVRLVESEVVDKHSHTLDDLIVARKTDPGVVLKGDLFAQNDENEQYIRHEEDLSNCNDKDYLPF